MSVAPESAPRPTRRSVVWRRVPVLVPAVLCLLAALAGGMVRLGTPIPIPVPSWVADHGTLMVGGFLGTLIGVERAVALARPWAWLAPLLTGAGGLLIAVGQPAGLWPVTLGSFVFGAVSVRIWNIRRADFTAVMALGAILWSLGNALLVAGRPVSGVVAAWIAYLLLTITGERLELSRIVRRSAIADVLFPGAVMMLVIGVLLALAGEGGGIRVVGVAMIGFAAWLGRWDLARVTVRQTGLPRYVAVCLLLGYAWLAVSGSLLAVLGLGAAGPRYDAALHSFFVGFVLSMIFGHAPVIFPAVLRARIGYHPALYVPLALLHVSLLVRLVGDLGLVMPARIGGGHSNAVIVVLFFVTLGIFGRRRA
jgi:hypothetical protein